MQESFFVRHSRTISIIAIATIVLCIILIIGTIIYNRLDRRTYLTIQFAPGTAHLELYDLGIILSNGTYEIAPGTYSGTITADGFDSKDITLTVAPRQVNSYTDYLVHTTEGLNYFERSATDISTLRNISDEPDITSFLESYDHKASLYNILPLTISWLKYPDDTPMYNLTITNGTSHSQCTTSLCLMTTGPKENLAELTQALSERGYDINDYEVFYEYSAI